MLHTKEGALPLILSLPQSSWAWSLPLDSCPELPAGLPWETARELQVVLNPRKEGKPSGMHCPDRLHIAQAPWQLLGTVQGLDLIHQTLQSETSRPLFFFFQNLDSMEAQLDLLVSHFQLWLLRKRTKVCCKRHFPAALGLGTNKKMGMVSAIIFSSPLFLVPLQYPDHPLALMTDTYLERRKKNSSHSRMLWGVFVKMAFWLSISAPHHASSAWEK